MKIFSIKANSIFTLIVLVALCGNAQAKAPWKWQMSLRADHMIGSMNLPTTLYIDEEKERYYVSDSGMNRLLSFDRNGKLLHSLNPDNQLKFPVDMIRSNDSGSIWVVEKGKNSLTEIDLKDKQVTPHTLSYDGRLVFPDRIEYNNKYIYLLDKASGNILVLDQKLSILQKMECPNEKGSGGFVDFKLTKEGIWALDQRKKALYFLNKDGNIAKRITLDYDIHTPVSFAIGFDNVIYVLDRLDGLIFAVDGNGHQKYSFLGSGQAQGNLYFPSEIRFDPWGQLCIVDEGNGRVEIFSR